MFDKMLVGVDGRQGGRDAIALARILASADAQIVLANIYGGMLSGGGRRGTGDSHLDAEDLLERERKAAGVQARTVVHPDGKPGRALQDLAAEESADLLVIGSTHRGPVGRVLIGDETLAALNGAPCAVAIAPSGYADIEHQLRSIGIGHDGSEESALALAAARCIGAIHGSSLRALAVVSLQTVPSHTPTPLDWTHETERVMKAERDRIDALEGVTGDVVYGDPSEELAGFAKDVDLLVVGSRANGPIGRLLSGSTSTYLARRSPCPLIVLPRGLVEAASGTPASSAGDLS